MAPLFTGRAIAATALAVAALATVGCSGTPAITTPPLTPATAAPATAAPTIALHGIVAVGRPVLASTITIKCSNGKSYTSLSDGSGSYTVSIDAGALPCVLESSGGTVAGAAFAAKLHSIALAAGVVNVTPLTELSVAAFARASATSYFSSTFDAAAWARLTAQALLSAQALVIANLQALALSIPATDFFTGTFSPVTGDAYDTLLSAIAAQTAASLQLLFDSVIAGIVGKYPVVAATGLLVPSMAGTWNTTETKINRLPGNQVSGVAVGDRCRIDVTSAGVITVTAGTHTWNAQVPSAAGPGNTLDANYAPYHYTGNAEGAAGLQIGFGYFGQSFTVFSDQTFMSTTIRLSGVDTLFCANYRYT